MIEISNSVLEKLPPYAKRIIDEGADSIEFPIGKRIKLVLIKTSKSEKAFEQGLVMSPPIEMFGEEFLILRSQIRE